MKRRGTSAGLGIVLSGVVNRMDRRGGGSRLRSVQAYLAWQRIAGALVLSHTTGAHLKGDTLCVYVDSPAWATELTAMAQQYATSLNTEAGQELVSKVSFTVSRRVSEEHRIASEQVHVDESYTRDVVTPVSLTELERAQVVASAASIPDAELREAVIRATIKDMEWKRGISARNAREEPREGV